MAHTPEQHNPNNQEVVSGASACRQEHTDIKPQSFSSSSLNGGQTTIRPPVNVKHLTNSPHHILSSGIDTLYLAVNLTWENRTFFDLLAFYKIQASSQNEPQSLTLGQNDNSDNWIFLVMAHGAKGYEWLLQNNEYTLKIGNWMEPKQRPSVMVEIRSETLWSHSPFESVNRIIELLEQQGATIHEIKPSRTDLCVDILLNDDL
jgi:hypothetical protein